MYHVFLQIFLHILKSFHEFCNTLYREQILHYFNWKKRQSYLAFFTTQFRTALYFVRNLAALKYKMY